MTQLRLHESLCTQLRDANGKMRLSPGCDLSRRRGVDHWSLGASTPSVCWQRLNERRRIVVPFVAERVKVLNRAYDFLKPPRQHSHCHHRNQDPKNCQKELQTRATAQYVFKVKPINRKATSALRKYPRNCEHALCSRLPLCPVQMSGTTPCSFGQARCHHAAAVAASVLQAKLLESAR